MSLYSKFLLLFLSVFEGTSLFADSSFSSALSGLKGSFSGTGGLFSGLGQGLEQSIGIVEGYSYNFRVFNDTPAPIGVAVQRVTHVLGAGFHGDVKDSAVVLPFKNSEHKFYDEDLYLDVWLLYSADKKDSYAQYNQDLIRKNVKWGTVLVPGIGSAIAAGVTSIEIEDKLEANRILHKKIPLGIKGDPNIYFYRTYTYKGEVNGEYLGIATTLPDFMGVFYNSSSKVVSLGFAKDSQSYQVTLEPGTFSLLSSSPGVENSIRPPKGQQGAFTFYQATNLLATIPLASEGIASMQVDPKSPADKPTFIPGAPYVYTYEVYDDPKTGIGVGLQGLSIGAHDQTLQVGTNSQPTAPVVRDINPVECYFWPQSVEQYNSLAQKNDPKRVPTAFERGGQLWCAYATKDINLQQKIQRGPVTLLTIFRPLISEGSAKLYCVWLDTDSDALAKKFLDRLCSGALGQESTTVSSQDFNINGDTILIEAQPNQRGSIDDTKGSGVKGVILAVDVFLPQGVGAGPFYYTSSPPLLDVSTLLNPLQPFLDVQKYAPKAGDDQESANVLIKAALSWATEYQKDPKAAAVLVRNFIKNNSYDAVAQDAQLSNELSALVIDGPLGLAHMPMIHQAGVNNYVYSLSQLPEGWPAQKTVPKSAPAA